MDEKCARTAILAVADAVKSIYCRELAQALGVGVAL